MTKSILVFIFGILISPMGHTKISHEDIRGVYRLESTFPIEITTTMEIRGPNQYNLVDIGPSFELNCSGRYVLVEEIFVGQLRCLNGAHFTHIINLTGINLKDLKVGTTVTVYNSLWEDFSHPMPVKVSRLK